MSAYLLLAVCPLLGWLTAHRGWMPANAASVFTQWLLRIALPAIVLRQIPGLTPDLHLLFPIAMPWLLVGASVVVMPLLGRRLGWDRGTVGAMINCCGFGNTSFVGFPMVVSVLGAGALGTAVVLDQFGTALAMSTLGIALPAWYAGKAANARQMAHRLITFPIFQALLVGLALRAFSLHWLPAVDSVLARLGDTLTPIALFIVGLQFKPAGIGALWKPVSIGLSWKLLIAPAVTLALGLLLGIHGYPLTVTVLELAMGPMISTSMLAQDNGLNPPLCAAFVSLGTLLAFFSAPAWAMLAMQFA